MAESMSVAQLRVAVVCGGPSVERGVSLNSARSIVDHLKSEHILLDCYYIDQGLIAFQVSTAQMYSNTPSDFDFKLQTTAKRFPTLQAFAAHLKGCVDIVFPAMHGKFGEDGAFQALLEEVQVPFVGTGANAARTAFDKFMAAQALLQKGFATLPSALVGDNAERDVQAFYNQQGLEATSRVVVKPARAGSSVGVRVAIGQSEAASAAKSIVADGIDDRVVIEAFAEGGREFSVIVLGTAQGAVALSPTEVELTFGKDRHQDTQAIFDYRRKYLPTNQVLPAPAALQLMTIDVHRCHEVCICLEWSHSRTFS